jgi:hypothetical protein
MPYTESFGIISIRKRQEKKREKEILTGKTPYPISLLSSY